MEEGDFWQDPEKAQTTIAKASALKSWIIPYRDLKRRFEDDASLLEEAEGDFLEELLSELAAIEKGVEELEIKKMLSGKLDHLSCFLSINAGAGGTESCDWVQMLARMYQRWAALRKWKVEVVDMVAGEIAGIKSITMKLEGPYSYGYAKAEKGVHRLVRISPFDSNARRHTSFASVEVSPEVVDEIDISVKSDELRVDTFRSSGAGGQHVNTTDSAVRMTHLPTGIVVSCQNQRSQIQNREMCMKMLLSKLHEKKILEQEAELKALSGQKMENAWGSQVRNYVFQPYTLVKDTRTKYEEGNVQAVMDGEIDGFVNAYLKEFGNDHRS